MFGKDRKTGYDTAYECKCRAKNELRRRLKKSGIHDAFRAKRFDNFKESGVSPDAVKAKRATENFVNAMLDGKRPRGMALLGTSGAGKTHLTIAAANMLIDEGISVVYMPYREAVTELKQHAADGDEYASLMRRYKLADVLLIDDLFKLAEDSRSGYARVRDADLRIMFELINHRTLTGGAIMVSSERTHIELLDIDAAIGGRIYEMCKDYMVLINDSKANYRLH